MRETARAWGFFDVVVPRAMPTKQHPDVQCRQCKLGIRNAQLSRSELPHLAYQCPSATTDMIDIGRRLIYEATVRKADRGDRVAQTKLALGEAGEPNWKKRQMRQHAWLHGDSSSSESEEEAMPPPAKKAKTTKALASKKTGKKPAAPSATEEPTEPVFEFSDEAVETGGGGLMVAEAFYQLGVPLKTLVDPTFRAILAFLNPNVTYPSPEKPNRARSNKGINAHSRCVRFAPLT